MKLSVAQQVNKFPASNGTRDVHCPVQKSPPLDSILKEMNPVDILNPVYALTFFSYLNPGLKTSLFSDYSIKLLYVFFLFLTRATYLKITSHLRGSSNSTCRTHQSKLVTLSLPSAGDCFTGLRQKHSKHILLKRHVII